MTTVVDRQEEEEFGDRKTSWEGITTVIQMKGDTWAGTCLDIRQMTEMITGICQYSL